jgi:hypothetical protein
MGLEFDLDVDADSAESGGQKSGSWLGVGKHEVTLEKVLDATAKSSGNTGSELWFRSASGDLHRETLWNSASAASKARIATLGERLGMLVKEGKKFKLAPGKKTLSDCVGARVVIELFADAKDARQDGTPRVKLAWVGIHKLDGAGGQQEPNLVDFV